MKTLALLFLLPLFTFAQEVPIGVRTSSVWTFSPEIVTQAQAGMDSIALKQSLAFDFVYDSVSYQNDSMITMWMHKGSMISVDRMFVQYRDDTLWTTPDPVKAACLNVCTYYSCSGGCLKTANCDCSCDGYCTSSSLGVMMDMPVGELSRRRILTDHNNEIPEE